MLLRLSKTMIIIIKQYVERKEDQVTEESTSDLGESQCHMEEGKDNASEQVRARQRLALTCKQLAEEEVVQVTDEG